MVTAINSATLGTRAAVSFADADDWHPNDARLRMLAIAPRLVRRAVLQPMIPSALLTASSRIGQPQPERRHGKPSAPKPKMAS
jgi:hypothetical protein